MFQFLNESTNDSGSECLGSLTNDGEVELDDEIHDLQDRTTGMVKDLILMSDNTEHTELDVKHMCHALHDVEGGSGEL